MDKIIRGVLIDMDGTLIDSKPTIEHAWCSVAAEYGVLISASEIEEHIHGRNGSYTLQRFFGHLPEVIQKEIKRKVDGIEETANTALIPGVEQALALFKTKGLKIALVTASWPERINYILSLHRIAGFFDVIVCRNDVTKGKPDPEGYIIAATKLGICANECIVFEDSLSGIQAGKNSGAVCIGIGNELPDDECLYQYDNFETVLRDYAFLARFESAVFPV